MAGYIRQDTTNNIADGNVINASDFDNEYNAIEAAFHATTGHTHDGTSAEGAPITKIGPTQDVVASATALTPKTDNTVDLGSATLEYKDLYIDGTANIDSLVADTADINAGTIDGVTIGGASAGAGTFTTVAATTGNITTVNATTVDATNLEVTNIKAKDGTASMTLADATGVATFSANPILNAGTANGVLYLNGSKVATSGSALTFDGSTLKATVSANSAVTANNVTSELSIQSVGNDGYINMTGTGGTVFRLGSGYTEAMRLTSTGLGIGTTPGAILHTVKTSAGAATVGAFLQNSDTTTGTEVRLAFAANTNLLSSDRYGWIGYVNTGGTNSGALTFATTPGGQAAQERMRINQDGNVGIGATSPSAYGKLNVNGNIVFGGPATRNQAISQGIGVWTTGDPSDDARAAITFNTVAGAASSSSNIVFSTNNYGVSGGERMRLDSSGNLGLGVTPSAWAGGFKAFDIASSSGGAVASTAGSVSLSQNTFYNGTNWIYKSTNPATRYEILGGAAGTSSHAWYTAPSGTAGAAISFTQAMTLDSSGNLGIGTSSPSFPLDVRAATNSLVQSKGTSGYGSFYANGATGSTAYYFFGINDVETARISSQSTNYIAFSTNDSGISEKMRITQAGNVGIGQTAPAYKLDVNGGIRTNSGFVGTFTTSGTNIYGTAQTNGTQTANLMLTGPSYNFSGVGANEAWLYGDANNVNIGPYGNFAIKFIANGLERMRLDAAGNLGLGVTPSAWNAGYRALEFGAGAALWAENGSNSNIWLSSNTTLNSGGSFIYKVTAAAAAYNSQSGQHRWYTAPSGTAGNTISFTQAMTLTSGGDLLVGDTTSVFGGGIYLRRNSGNAMIDAYAASTSEAKIQLLNNNNSVAIGNGSGGELVFYANTRTSERARITSGGSLLVGTQTNEGRLTSVVDNSTTDIAVFARTQNSYTGVIYKSCTYTAAGTGWYHFIGQSGDGSSVTTNNIFILGNGNVQNTNNSYGAISDIKLKENITDATPKLDGLMQVRVVNYNLKTQPDQKHIGVIAQELEQVFPGMVEETPDRDADGELTGETTKAVKYSVFVPMLIKALQEQQAIIESLKARLDAANL